MRARYLVGKYIVGLCVASALVAGISPAYADARPTADETAAIISIVAPSY